MKTFTIMDDDGRKHVLTPTLALNAREDLASWPASVEGGTKLALNLLYNRVRC